jgi:hypothetical protein
MERLVIPAFKEYAFVPGGLLWKLIDKAGFERKGNRFKIMLAIVFVLLCWLPLVLLSFYQLGWNQFFQLFVRDVATQVRFLFVFPLLLFARPFVRKRFKETIQIFYDSNIINQDNHIQFEKNVDWLFRWRNSLIVDILLIILVYYAFYVRETGPSILPDFYAPWLRYESKLSAAGWWYVLFSLPLLQLILYRWLYNIVTWIIFLWKTSKIDLKLSSLHPDGVGGLGFLRYTQLSFFPVALGFSSVVAAGMSNLIIFSGASIHEFAVLIGSLLVFVILLFILPLLVFVPLLASVKRKYFFEYSKDAWDFARTYEKELKDFYETGENRPDTSWHVDLIGSFEKTDSMGILLIDKVVLLSFVFAVILPFIPVIAQEIPLTEVIKTLVSKFLG